MNEIQYNAYVKEHSNALYSYAMKLVKEGAKAQDLVQESFVKLWMKRDFIEEAGVKPFLFKVLYNKMVDDYRKMKRVSHPESLPESSYRDQDLSDRDLIDQAFAQLKERQKNIILLRDWEGYSYDEIAEIMGLNLGQVKVNLFRARKKMKEVLLSLDQEQIKKRL